MEEKKLDVNSIIGFGLIFVILIWVMYNSQQKEAAAQVKKAQQEQVEAKANPTQAKVVSTTEPETQKPVSDSVQVTQLKSSLGSFAYSATLPSAKAAFTTIENELVRLKIANKGGYIVEAEIKQFDQFTKDSGKKVQLIKDGNANFNIELKTNDNRTLNTKDLFFEPVLTKEGTNQV
ncbi:MAG TPA: YidC/Oxa1 family insertase periplasmic-domain containing protein, partial [Flavobacterium sp.]|nr:YidC/Oxa1 family insertase periplasmic-domain containing protein [Flavobacterium sp.]